MSVNDRRFKVRDVVNSTDEFGARTFVIIAITETGYRAVAMKDKKRYNLTDGQIAVQVGRVEEDSPLLVQDEYDQEEGEAYCQYQARQFPSEAKKWRVLANLKPGDAICLVHRKTVFREAEFVAINFKKPLYPIRARIKGLVHDFHLEAMLVDRSEGKD